MKIVFLNAWYGERENDLSSFIKEQVLDTDLFCLQEADPRVREIFEKVTSGYKGVFVDKNLGRDKEYGQAIYFKNGIDVRSVGSLFEDDDLEGLGQFVEIIYRGRPVTIFNYHGVINPGDKLDSPIRLDRTKNIIESIGKNDSLKVVGGDFNLLPDTDSIRAFKASGYRDLIQEFDIKTTRNEFAWANYPNNKQYYADYVFLSKEWSLKSFSVPDLEVSDHLPMILDIDV